MNAQDRTYTPPVNGFRTFSIMWASQALSVFGSQVMFFAVTVWLTATLYPLPEQRPLLAAALSAVALAFAVPNVLAAPLAGVVVDRSDRKTVMLWSNLAAGAVSTAMMWMLAIGRLGLPGLIGFQVLFSLLQCFHNSAFEASYAMLVPEKQLPRANGMMQTIFSLSGILSPAIAAALIAVPALLGRSPHPGWLARMIAGLSDGAVLAIGLDALTFFAAAAVLPFLTIPSPRRAPSTGGAPAAAATGAGTPMPAPRHSFWGDVKEGIGFILQRRGMLWLLTVFAVSNLCGAPAGVLQAIIVRDNLDFAARGLSYEATLALLGSVAAVGGVVGGLLVTATGGLKRRRILGVLLPLAVGSVAQIVFGLTGLVYVAAAAAAFRVFAGPVANVHSQTIWQSKTPREMQGRVFAVRRVVAQFTWPLGTALSGWAGARLGPGTAVALFGLVSVVYFAAQLFNPTVMHVEENTQNAYAVAAGPAAGAPGAIATSQTAGK